MSTQEQTPETDVSLEDIELPIKRTTGETLEERLTANAYHNILPARYLKKDENGNLVESQEDLFVRVGQNVALAEAVYELERQGETIEVTPDQIKPNHHARGRLAGEVFGFDTDEFDEVGDLPKDLDEAQEFLVHDSVELDEHNVNKFAYETLIDELPADIKDHVESVAEVYTEMHEKLDFIANSPTLMNAGDDLQQLSACFVNSPEDDMDDIHETAKEAAKTFKCLTEDATVFEQTRGMISVADVDEGDSILQRTEDGVQYKPVEETHEYDDAETITLTLENGLTIQGTPNHELEINGEWNRLDNAEEGDSLSYSLGWIEQIDSRSPILATVEAGAQWANNRKVSNEEIMELYHQGLSDYEMAEELGVGKSTVQRRRNNELNLPPNGQGGRKQGSVSFDESEAHGLIKEGKTDSQVASALELSQATVQQFRTKNKIDANGTPVKEVTQPQYMSVNLAELVGLWAGDGSYHNDGIRFHIGRDEIVEWVEETVASLFDTTVSKSYSDGCYEVCINSHEIKRWWKTNFDVKSNGAQNVTTPTVITQSTPAEMKGYLRGYFSADGSVNDGKYPVVYSSSETAIDQMATLLMGLDMPVKKSVIKDDESHPYYSVTVTTQHGRETFKSEIGFLDSREIIEVQSPRDTTYDGNSHFEVKITDTTVDENSTVYDLTVTDNHQYITDGIVSHNSGGGMGYAFWQLRPTGDPVGSSGGVSSGPITFMNTFDQMCETVAQGGTRRGAQMGVMRVSHPDVIEFIHAKNKDVSLAHTLRLNDPDDYTHNKFIDALNEARELIDDEGKVPKHLRNAVEGHLSNFNISVGITDDFMEAVKNDEDFVFTNPRTEEPHIVTEQTAELYEMFGYGEYVEEGEVLAVPAREIWDDIIDGAHENGEPGVIYLERANNKHSFDVDEHPEHRILATNPCVAEGTLVNTPNGYKRVEDVEVGEEISTVIGSEPVDEIEVHQDKDVKRVRFSDGSFLDVTEDHIFHLLDGKEVVDTVRLKDVEDGDTIRLDSAQIQVDGTKEDYNTHLQKGVLIGDGCYTEQTLDVHNVVKIAGNEDETAYNENLKDLFQNQKFRADDTHADGKSMNMVMSDGGAIVESLGLDPSPAHNKDFDVTELDSKQAALGLLDGLLASDGNVNLNSTHPQIRWDTASYELAQSIRQALLLLGVHGRISISSKADRGGVIDDRKISANYDKHTVNVSGAGAGKYAQMSNVGDIHPTKGQALREMQTSWMTTGNTWKAQIESIEDVEDKTTVYDLYCEESDTWITSGYVSRGCGEQPLEEYEACNLGHINFSTLVADNPEYQDYRAFVEAEGDQYDTTEETVEAFLEQALDWEEFNHRIEYGTRFLEDVVTMSDFPIDKIEEKVGNMRKIGLGIMGYAQILVQLGIQYGSESANELARQMMTHMNHESKRVSHRIAVGDEPGMDRGVFAEWNNSKYADPTGYKEWFEHHTGENADEWADGGFPLRNHNTTTIAPTGTTSMVGNTTGGCEPMFNVAYMKNVSDDVQGEEMLVEFDDYFLRVLEANDIDIEPVKDEAKELMQNNEFEGAQDLTTVPTEIAELFITTSEVTGLEHASVQCAFQDGVDSSISKTANFPNSASKEDMREVYEYIYENGGKGVTVYRDGTRSKQVLTTRADNTEFSDEGEFTEFLTEQINEGTVTVEQVIDTLQEEFDVRATESADGQLGLSEYRKRPDALVGINQRINTGYGTLYVWISEDVNGNMFEVFASIGKAGGYTQSFTEALCRMISMALRYGVPPQRIVKHLSGIQSPKVAWENQEQVASVADGIAMAMDNYLEHNGVVGLITEMRTDDSDLADQLLGSEPPEDLDVEAQRQGVDEALEGEDADFEVGASVDLGGPMENGQEPDEVDTSTQDLIAQGESPECPDCGLMSVYMSEGCKTCESCGWSEC